MREIRKVWPLFPAELATVWQPRVDVYRTRKGWLLKVELAGVKLQDVSVTIHGRRVAISGCRKDSILEEGASHYLMEISYSRFERVIDMPCGLETARVTLEARDGLVLVHLITEGHENG
ncbi:MAG TPA: Hsp20/alpha crystallin family protein [Bryobacteraceae bacterium]|nr:Hsp20/alpha crystallin family protein [Bryobacteraceae bacterium]